jgi:hypothetical protein
MIDAIPVVLHAIYLGECSTAIGFASFELSSRGGLR